MVKQEMRTIWIERILEAILFVFAGACFVYSGKFLMSHQVEVLAFVRSFRL